MRLIDADVYRKILKQWISECNEINDSAGDIIFDCVCQLDDAPTIDPESLRPHGRWEHTHTSASYYSECWKCSVCGFEDTEGYDFKYCPNCGAKMDLEE